MAKKTTFQAICAAYSCDDNHIIDFESDYDDYDCHDTCVVWNNIIFYGIPFDILDDNMGSIYEGDYKDAVKIGELFGCLILCRQIIDENEEPLIICDDIDGDLEYTISALSDDGPLNPEQGDPYQDVYYIHELKMKEGYDEVPLKSRIINDLPQLILKFCHVLPDILAFYSSPLEYTRDPDKEARYKALQHIHSQKISSVFEEIIGEKQKGKEDNIVKFGDSYRFTEDEVNMVMGRRHSGSSYPEEAKNMDEYAFYEANGFEEAGDSRLLYKCVWRD